jgi:hypothetical protein
MDDYLVKHVLSTQDRSLAESLRIALEGEGIETIEARDLSLASHAPATVAILRDEDYEQALRVLQTVSASQRPSRFPTWFRWPVRLALLLIVLWAIIGTIDWLIH